MAFDEPIAVDTPAPTLDPISVDTGTGAPSPLPQGVIDTRSNKAAFGLNNIQTLEQLRNSISTGQERTARTDAASQIDLKKQQQLQQTIAEVSTRKGGPLTTQELAQVSEAVDRNNKFTDPTSVFEEEFSKRYLNILYGKQATTEGSWLQDAYREIPQHVQAAVDTSSSYLSKDEFLRTKIEDAEADVASQSWTGYLVDKGKNLATMGLYDEYKLRANIPGTPLTLGLGSSLQEQRAALYRLPFPEFKDAVTKTFEYLNKDNPSLAAEFLHSMLGKSSADILADNLGTAITVATLPGIGGIGKRLLGFRVNKAATDIVRSAEDWGPTQDRILSNAWEAHIKSSNARGVGDLPEAAIQKVTGDLVNDLRGRTNPAQQALDELPRILNLQEEEILANPGVGGREAANRLSAAIENLKGGIVNLITTRLNVDRVPALLATEDGVRAIWTNIKDKYPNLSGRFLGMSNPLRERASNTFHIEMQLGDEGAALFTRPETAAAFARTQGILLKGEADAARQLELQRLLHVTEGQMDYARQAINITEEQKAKLGLTGVSKAEANLKTLETQHVAYTKELGELRNSLGATVEQQGTGYYVSKWVSLNENDRVYSDFLLTTEASKSPKGYFSSYMSWLRTPEETTSLDARENAKVLTYTQSNLLAMAKAEVKEITKLAKWTFPGSSRKERWLDFERTLKEDQVFRNSDGETGKSFKNPAQLEDHYLRSFNRMPLPQEVDAYFAHKRFMELDGIFRDLQVYRNKAANGVEQHSFNLIDRYGKKVQSQFIDAVAQKEFPGGEDAFLVLGRNVRDNIQLFTPQSMAKTPKLLKEVMEAVKKGEMKVVRVFDPEDRALSRDPAFMAHVGDERVRYVISKNVETKPLSFKQVNRREGGHFDYDYDHYIKQAKVRFSPTALKFWYEGDTTVMPMQNRSMAGNIAKLMDNVRILLKEGKEAEAEVAARALPFDWATHKGWYKESHAPGGETIPPRFSLHEPFHVVGRGEQILDMDNALKNRYQDNKGNTLLKDGTRQGSDARQFQVQYTGKRDAYEINTIVDKGSVNNPLYSVEPARLVDPIPSMNRAMARIVNSAYMDDYKMFAMRHWLQEAKNHIKGDWEDILHAPFHYFYKGELLPGTPLDIRSRLEASRFKSQQIMGTPSAIDTFLHSVSSKLADFVYDKAGPTRLDPSWMIPKLTDAARFTRAAAYHAVIGFFAPAQILVQSMTYATIFGIEGASHALPGTLGAMLHQLSRLNRNPAILGRLDEIASKMGFKPGEWAEARELLHRTGFHNVGGEHALLDSQLSPKVITSGAQSFLNLGTIFFQGAERNARFGAWYTAYHKFRELNPVGRVTDTELKHIFENAELLSGNMSAASKSLIQRGPMSFPTQFLAYNMRMAELFTGHRITVPQRMRLFATYFGLFGVSAFGLAGLPLGDIIRTEGIKNGYTGDLSELRTWMMEGLPSAALEMTTGHRYNIGSRFGSTGLDPIRDALAGDKSMWTLMAGASGSILSTAWDQSDGFRSAMMSLFRDDDTYFPLKADDFTDPLKTIASFNAGSRLLAALNTTNWLSKKGQILDKDVSAASAIFMTATGTQSQSAAEIHNFTILEEDRKNTMKHVEQEFMREGQKAINAAAANNPEQSREYWKRARAQLIMGGYPLEKWGSLVARLAKGNETVTQSIEANFYTRNVPPKDAIRLQDTYKKKLQLEQGKLP